MVKQKACRGFWKSMLAFWKTLHGFDRKQACFLVESIFFGQIEAWIEKRSYICFPKKKNNKWHQELWRDI